MTVPQLLEAGREDDVALAAPGREPLRFGALRRQVARSAGALRRLGVAREDRVAVVADSGSDAAAALLAVMGAAVAAPLNPALRREEATVYLAALRARVLLVEAGQGAGAVEAARALGLPILALESLEAGGAAADAAADAAPGPDGVALVLHTSGTTSRPKIVPLTHRNLTRSAGHVAAALGLTAADRGLLIMPLFHVHGLVAGLLAPLGAGGSVFVPGRFDALRFFGWVKEAQPTWYTAVPTMHQAILARAGRNRDAIACARLRLVRSSSAPLAPAVMEALEGALGAPVIEAYGMTEAAHQIASNPLPPAARKPGTVGLPAGPEIAILDEEGGELPRGREGEVGIRGANVMAGYEGDAAASAAAFAGPWFRTGDRGALDAEGYLRLTGRLKELINRGGEKIAPREIDEALLAHPAVEQAVAFAVPHQLLGEEVAAAVVLRAGASATEEELRRHVAAHLADFKVPRRIALVDEIPVGATGKLQRADLARRLGLAP